MNVPFKFRTVGKTTEETALLDSGATENFLDERAWQRLRLRRFSLPRPLTVHNVDGSENRQGKIDSYCWIKVRYRRSMIRMRFYITSLGDDDFILGYPFLYAFNPNVDWRRAKLRGGQVQLETIPFQRAERRVEMYQREALRLAEELDPETEVWARRSTVAQQWAREAHQQDEKPMLPPEYRRHAKVFSEEGAK